MAIPAMASTFDDFDNNNKVLKDLQDWRGVPQYLNIFLELYKNVTPLMVIQKRLGNVKTVRGKEFWHIEDDEHPQVVTLGEALDNSETAIDLASGHGKRVWDGCILYSPITGEQMEVTAVSTDTITVVRGHASTVATAQDTATDLQIMPMTDADNGRSPTETPWSEPNQLKNYCQIVKEAYAISRRMKNAQTFGPDELARMKKQTYRSFCYKLEKAILFGQLDSGATNGATTGGLEYWLSTNKMDADGNWSEDLFEEWLQEVFRFNQGENVLILAGEYLLQHINTLSRDRLTTSPGDTVGGIRITKYRCAHGEVSLVPHGMLTKTFDASGEWAGTAFAVNLNNLKLAFYQGGDIALQTGLEENDRDGEKGQWFCDFGVWVGAERTHGMLYNLPDPFAA